MLQTHCALTHCARAGPCLYPAKQACECGREPASRVQLPEGDSLCVRACVSPCTPGHLYRSGNDNISCQLPLDVTTCPALR